jgi:transposase
MQKHIELLAKNNFKLKLPMNWAYKFEYPKDIIKERYEIVTVLEKAYDEFHKMLMGKERDDLKYFIRRYETSAIKGFIEGNKKDIAPVKNAISHDVSSGFVEGNNNKFKLINRILYGRADLVNLFKKSYIAFQSKLNNFNLLQITQTDAVK